MSDISQITLGGVTYDIKDEVARTQIQNLNTNKANVTQVNALDARVEDVEDDVQSLIAAVGTPLVASTASQMTDHNKIYVYTGNETGYTSGNWYYWNGSAWTSGGTYNSIAFTTDKTLTVENAAADAKVVGDEFDNLKSAINNIEQDVYDSFSLNVSPLSPGAYEATGYGAAMSNKWVFTRKFGPGIFTIIPAVGWSIEHYKYISDVEGVQIYSVSSKERTIEATDFQFIASARKTDNTAYTELELTAFIANTIIKQKNSDDNNMTARLSVIEGNIGDLESELVDDEADITLLGTKIVDNKNAIEKLNEETLPYVRNETTWTNGVYELNGYEELPSESVTNKYSKKYPPGDYIVTPTEHLKWEAYYYVNDDSGTQLFSFSNNTRRFTASSDFIVTIGNYNGGSLDGLESEIDKFDISTKNLNLIDKRRIHYDSKSINTQKYNHVEYIDRLKYESLVAGTSVEIGIDTDIVFQDYPYSIYFKTDPTRTNSECRINYATPFKLLGTQEFDIAVYIPDATKITSIRISVPSSNFVKSSSGQTLVDGWNFIRVFSEGAGSWADDTDNTQIRVLANHSSGSEETVYIGYFAQVKPEYANMMIIADGPYYSFYTEAYPALKAMGVPVVWALDPALLDTPSTTPRKLINEAELELLAYDGISEFSFHNYDGTIMSDASAELALEDTMKSIRYLKQHGLEPERIFRAAWLQNSCAHPELANLELDASASYTGASGVAEYPFVDKYDIPRYGLASRTEENIDAMFEKMRRQHCTTLFYFHGISEGSDKEVTPAMLTYILNKISAAISSGYLYPTTYNRLTSYYSKTD